MFKHSWFQAQLAVLSTVLLAETSVATYHRSLLDEEERSVEDCLIVDKEHVGAIDELYDDFGGGWIDDGDVLKKKWSPGMGVVAINYCADGDLFKSMQVVVGNDEEEIKLRKHGGKGGKCRKWRLQAEDYIRDIQYTWAIQTMEYFQ